MMWSACCSGSSPTHRFSTSPKSRRTVISIPPRWWHGGLRSTAPSRSILLSSPRWGRLIAFLQRPNHGALSFLSRPGGGNTLAMRFLHMARLCHGTLSFLSRPGGGNTLATARIAAYGTPMPRHLAKLRASQVSVYRSLMATWFRDKEALWCGQPQSVTPDHRLIVFHLTGCY